MPNSALRAETDILENTDSIEFYYHLIIVLSLYFIWKVWDLKVEATHLEASTQSPKSVKCKLSYNRSKLK